MDIGEVLSRAWRIIWRFKVLWLFGILAGCSQVGSSGGGNSGWRFSAEQDISTTGIERFFRNLNLTDAQIALFIGLLLLFILVTIVLIIVLETVGRIGLIQGVLSAERGAERLTFGELLNGSMQYFWRVLAVNLLIGFVLYLAAFVIGLPLGILTCGIGLLCFPVLFWFISLILEQANIAIVVENRGVFDGLQRAWSVVSSNLGQYIVMALILYLGIGLIVGLIIGLPVAFILGPVIGAVVVAAISGTNIVPAGLAVSLLGFLVYLPILILLNGILRSYISSAWTLTFMRLSTRAALPESYSPPV